MVFSDAGSVSSSYADDNSTFRIFTLPFQYETLAIALPKCLQKVKCWMNEHILKLNDEKTKIIAFGDKLFNNTLAIHGTFLESGVCLRLADCVKHLGVYLDSALTFNYHVSKLISACNSSLRSIRSIRKFLS